MNIEEAVKRIEQMGEYERFIDEPISKVSVLNTIRQINQPKPEVPQFVADWYEEHKEHLDWGIFDVIWTIKESYAETEFECWLDNNEYSIQTLINMHQFGYTVKKEKLYTVEIPTNSEAKLALVRREDKKIVITIPGGRWRELDIFQLTEEEIRKDFDWAWQWKKEVTE